MYCCGPAKQRGCCFLISFTPFRIHQRIFLARYTVSTYLSALATLAVYLLGTTSFSFFSACFLIMIKSSFSIIMLFKNLRQCKTVYPFCGISIAKGVIAVPLSVPWFGMANKMPNQIAPTNKKPHGQRPCGFYDLMGAPLCFRKFLSRTFCGSCVQLQTSYGA